MCTIHYGASRSLDDYFQESGRAGRGGEQSTSMIYWAPSDVPVQQDISDPRNVEVAVVRRYLENNIDCRRYLLQHYFDPALLCTLERRDRRLYCDTSRQELTESNCKFTYNARLQISSSGSSVSEKISHCIALNLL